MDTMIITEEEALLVVIMISYHIHYENFNISGDPSAEGLGIVQLLRKIAKDIPSLQSNVELTLKGE